MKYLQRLQWFKNHKWITAILLIIIICLAVIFRPKPPAEIPTEEVKKGKIVQLITSSGSIHAKREANLSFLVGGKLTYVGVTKGTRVTKGKLIALLDQRSAQTNLENALIDYSQQRNTFDQTKENYNGHNPSDALTDAMKRILQNNQYDLDKAVNSVELLDLTRQNLALYSPIDGIVTRADITNPGINAGVTTTYSIIDPDSLVFEIDVDETDIAKVHVGQEAQIILEAYPDDRIFTKVLTKDFASHKTDTGGNAYTVEAGLPANSKFDYLLGMNGDADIVLAEKQDALIIPIVALADEKFVYVKRKGGFEKKVVSTGLLSDTEIEVISGITHGDRVALQPEEARKQVTKTSQ